MRAAAIAFLAAIGLAALNAPADAARIETFGHTGSWTTFGGVNDQGRPVCGMGLQNAPRGRAVLVRYIVGDDFSIVFNKANWHIPLGTQVRIGISIDGMMPWTGIAVGRGTNLFLNLGPNAVLPFLKQFHDGSVMTVVFPDGDEDGWRVDLTGSGAAVKTFATCVDMLHGAHSDTQPFGHGTPSQRPQPNAPPPRPDRPPAAARPQQFDA